jgi:hypothetical protein
VTVWNKRIMGEHLALKGRTATLGHCAACPWQVCHLSCMNVSSMIKNFPILSCSPLHVPFIPEKQRNWCVDRITAESTDHFYSVVAKHPLFTHMDRTTRIPRRALQLRFKAKAPVGWEKFWNPARREQRAGKELRRKDCRKKEEIGEFVYWLIKWEKNKIMQVLKSVFLFLLRHTIGAHLHKKGSKHYPQLAKILALPPRTYSCWHDAYMRTLNRTHCIETLLQIKHACCTHSPSEVLWNSCGLICLPCPHIC